jgi:hypothetical protein
MSKSNNSTKLGRAKIEVRVLINSELDAVTGGRTVGAVSVGALGYTIHIPMGLPVPPFSPPLPPVRDDRAR